MRRAQFEAIVDQALQDLPPWVRERLDNIHLIVEDWPTRQQDPAGEGILGIYEGISLPERGDWYSGALPDRIVLFRGPHLQLRLTPTQLRREIRRTVLHEIAHHLGIDDTRLTELGWD